MKAPVSLGWCGPLLGCMSFWSELRVDPIQIALNCLGPNKVHSHLETLMTSFNLCSWVQFISLFYYSSTYSIPEWLGISPSSCGDLANVGYMTSWLYPSPHVKGFLDLSTLNICCFVSCKVSHMNNNQDPTKDERCRDTKYVLPPIICAVTAVLLTNEGIGSSACVTTTDVNKTNSKAKDRINCFCEMKPDRGKGCEALTFLSLWRVSVTGELQWKSEKSEILARNNKPI